MSTQTDQVGGAFGELSRKQCFGLLASQPIGRLAATNPGGPPLVVPVNFVLDGEVIVFRTDPGLKLQLLENGPISFQVDFVDPYHHTGWSVLATGLAAEASYWEVSHLALESWSAGLKRHWVRLVVTEVTGRSLDHRDIGWATDQRGYL